MKKVGAFEAKTHLAEYLRDVEQNGEPIVIQRYGKDVAVLQPCSAVEQNQKKKKTAEVLAAFEQIRKHEACCGRNEDVRGMVESGRKR